MAGIFTRKELTKILSDENLTPEERADQIFSLYGRSLDDGYVTKGAAEAAQKAALETAKEAWIKEQPKVNVKETPEYLDLQKQYDGYRAKQTALGSADFAEVKPKFRDRVYDLLDHADGAKPVNEQISELKKEYEEYFIQNGTPAPQKPQFGAKPEGSIPTGNEGAIAAFQNAWGFPTNKK